MNIYIVLIKRLGEGRHIIDSYVADCYEDYNECVEHLLNNNFKQYSNNESIFSKVNELGIVIQAEIKCHCLKQSE